jgi:uncharacterized membrane protein YraQ (UPF0718 family)
LLSTCMNQNAQIFFSTIVAVFLEAAPFLLLGALPSSAFEIYIPQDLLEKYLPMNYTVLSESHLLVAEKIAKIKEPEIPYIINIRSAEPYAY